MSAVGVALGVSAWAGPPVPAFRDVTYAVVEGVALQLDLYLPEGGAGPWPLVVWIHGGGWQAGSRFPIGVHVAGLLDHGIAVASVSYRLTGDTRFAERTFPAQIHDVKGAVRFLRASAEAYNLDPARFGAWGSSAGGHLAALLATSGGVAELEGDVGGNLQYSSQVRVAADYFGPTSFETMGSRADAADSPESALLGCWLGDVKANWTNPSAPYPGLVARVLAAGSLHHVDPGDPPMFIAHGDADTTVPIAQSVALADALKAAGVHVVLHVVLGAGHNAAAMPAEAAHEFLARQLGVPRSPRRPSCTR